MDNRDAIDFANTKVIQLFRRMFIPTLVGMLSMVVLNITDGVFVGHGCGSDSLAAVNIVAPLFLLSSGLGLMFGVGGCIVASIHLAKGKTKAANINITQSLLGAFLLGSILSAFVLMNKVLVCRLFGCSDSLIPLACDYLIWIAAFVPVNMIGLVGNFIIRLDGSPKISMGVNLMCSLLNILLDYVFIFILHMGLYGAAMATSFSFAIGCLVVLYYILFKMKSMTLHRLKFSVKSFLLTIRNLYYQIRLGLAAMLGEIAIAVVIVVGNYQFESFLGDDGVAAYSVACYCLPIIFMFANAIVQSVQPIISFGHGAGYSNRISQACHIAFVTSVTSGAISMMILLGGSFIISAMFLNTSCRAYMLCCEGLPYFSACCLFTAINIVSIGYFQCVEKPGLAFLFTLLRGFVFVVPSFVVIPLFLGIPGIWLALPVTEGLTSLILLGYYVVRKFSDADNSSYSY